jgi:hypothetical protein
VTNGFPPTFGGVQQYVYNLVANLPADRITVLARPPMEPHGSMTCRASRWSATATAF